MLTRLISADLSSNIKSDEKCVFGASKIMFLGRQISRNGIMQDTVKLKVLSEMKPPTDAKGVKRVLGVLSYYWGFIERFAIIAEPLTKLKRKEVDAV